MIYSSISLISISLWADIFFASYNLSKKKKAYQKFQFSFVNSKNFFSFNKFRTEIKFSKKHSVVMLSFQSLSFSYIHVSLSALHQLSFQVFLYLFQIISFYYLFLYKSLFHSKKVLHFFTSLWIR
jgi:hypothetical protein